MEQNHNNRRDFLKKMGSVIGVGLSLPVLTGALTSCEQDENPVIPEGTVVVKLSDYPLLAAVGGSVSLSFPEITQPVIIVRNSDTEFLVANTKCTHLGCTVAPPVSEAADMACPCHGAVYSRTDASVVNHPAGETITPLTTYENEYDLATNSLTINFSVTLV